MVFLPELLRDVDSDTVGQTVIDALTSIAAAPAAIFLSKRLFAEVILTAPHLSFFETVRHVAGRSSRSHAKPKQPHGKFTSGLSAFCWIGLGSTNAGKKYVTRLTPGISID